MTMKIVDLFESFQGEGPDMGRWCTFLRLAGCNLKCEFCDTATSWNTTYATIRRVEDVAKMIRGMGNKLVVVTGGEPTLQYNQLFELSKCLPDDYQLTLESNGTADHEVYQQLSELDWKLVISPKKQSNWVNNAGDLCYAVKYVVDDDFIEYFPTIKEHKNPFPTYLQPCDGENIQRSMENIKEMVRITSFRAGIQLHKYYKVL